MCDNSTVVIDRKTYKRIISFRDKRYNKQGFIEFLLEKGLEVYLEEKELKEKNNERA
jgi:hypothetical protein